MDDGSFDENFTWFEWGFVSPTDVDEPEARKQPETQGFMMAQVLETWDEDHRWPT